MHDALRLLLLTVFCALPVYGQERVPYAPVLASRPFTFPADHGSHPDFHTEWWYVTGWLQSSDGPLGFQITFFRTRPDVDPRNPSAFLARQLLIVHAALSDPAQQRLYHDQRVRRAGLSLAGAATDDTRVEVDGWRLEHRGKVFSARIDTEQFALRLELAERQSPMANGEAGYSRKGPLPGAASYYYSLPHLAVSGQVIRAGRSQPVTGEAWFDHEWSSQYLDAQADGWEWTGINLADGGALMAFRIRGRDGTKRWAGGSLRTAQGALQVFAPEAVDFLPQRNWRSPRTGVSYPVVWQLRLGERRFDLMPLMDDQENDTRASTGAIYWEGAIDLREGTALAGRGYLELTGYEAPLKLP